MKIIINKNLQDFFKRWFLQINTRPNPATRVPVAATGRLLSPSEPSCVSARYRAAQDYFGACTGV